MTTKKNPEFRLFDFQVQNTTYDEWNDEVMFIHRGRLMEKSAAPAFFTEPKNDLAQAFLRGELLWWQRRELTPP